MTKLHELSLMGDRDQVLQELAKGADPNASIDSIHDHTKRSPLHFAAACSHRHKGVKHDVVGTIAALLDAGARVNKLDSEGGTPLHRALQWDGAHEAVPVLLDAGADPNRRPRRMWQLSCLASAARNAPNHVEPLLDAGAVGATPGELHGHTALHYAAENNHAASVRALLRAGFHHSARTDAGRTPLHMAARNDSFRALGVLIEHGADPNETAPDGATPLHMAVSEGHAAAAMMLIRKHADPNRQDNQGRTAVHCALPYHPEFVSLLAVLVRGALTGHEVDWSRTDQDGQTALHRAVEGYAQSRSAPASARAAAAATMIGLGADPRTPNQQGKSPLAYAECFEGTEAVRRVLLEATGGHASAFRGEPV